MFLYKDRLERNLLTRNCDNDITKSDEYRRKCSKYNIGLQSYDVRITLPPEADVLPFPNLGAKVNHSFRVNNTYFRQIEHPRWGICQSVTTHRDIKAGEELFSYYGYRGQSDFPQDFPWYFEEKMKFDREMRLKEKEKIARSNKRKATKKRNHKATKLRL